MRLVEDAVLRLAQAAVRVSDLYFTMRERATEIMADEVGEWLTKKEIPFERAVNETGRSGQKWMIDYRTITTDRISLVFLLSTGSKAAGRRIAEHVLAGCVDLAYLQDSSKQLDEPKLSLISLFDDSEDLWREKDFRLVEQHSKVAYWSRQDEFERVLTGA